MRNSITMDICTITILALSVITVSSISHPSFVSEWKSVRAEQITDLAIEHNLNSLPAKVDVQVKAVDGDNNGFIFPGTSSPQSDDDANTPRGGVLYIYNENEIRIFMPVKNNGYAKGRAIYTGTSANRIGPNTQNSIAAEVRARVWSSCDFPKPDFVSDWMDIMVNKGTASFLEIPHNLGQYPAYLTVQVKLLDGSYAGYYIDGTGTCMVNHGSVFHYAGLIFGYDADAIRIWVPATSTYGTLFGLIDGWETSDTKTIAKQGQVRVTAWLSLGASAKQTVTPHGPGVVGELYELHLRRENSFNDDILVNVEVQAIDGVNKNFRFPGTGSAMEVPGKYGKYGGVVYAYSNETVRFWRPTDSNAKGFLVNIGTRWGGVVYSQQSKVADIVTKVWEFEQPEYGVCASDACILSQTGYRCSCCAPKHDMCSDPIRHSKMELYANDASVTNGTYIAQYSKTSIIGCSSMCLLDVKCGYLSFGNFTCILYKESAINITPAENSGWQVWKKV